MINKSKIKSKVKVIPLGGLGEIGKNLTVFEYEDEIMKRKPMILPVITEI